MIIGIKRRQLILLLLALCVPILLNAIAIWQDVGTDSMLKIWNGAYKDPFGIYTYGPYYPLPEIFLNLLLIAIPPGLLAWLMIFISNAVFFQKQPLMLKLIETFLSAWFVAKVFEVVAGFLMPLSWLPKFHDYLLGLPGSAFTYEWSRGLVFPVTAVTLSIAVFLSGKMTRDMGK